MKTALTPCSGYGYTVTDIDTGAILGVVERNLMLGTKYNPIWTYANDLEGWYGQVGTQRQAVATLVELASRSARK
jgi:hypothetical protein